MFLAHLSVGKVPKRSLKKIIIQAVHLLVYPPKTTVWILLFLRDFLGSFPTSKRPKNTFVERIASSLLFLLRWSTSENIFSFQKSTLKKTIIFTVTFLFLQSLFSRLAQNINFLQTPKMVENVFFRCISTSSIQAAYCLWKKITFLKNYLFSTDNYFFPDTLTFR